ncbi:MAG: hypothetical protein AAF772_16080 [Acidobacteriota bacterium]
MTRFSAAALALVALFVAGCASVARDPIPELRRQLKDYDMFSIVLEDMDETGTFVDTYSHQYKLIFANVDAAADAAPELREEVTDWIEVSRATYRRYAKCLGMTIAADGDALGDGALCQPAGYRYVGDARYGRWQTGANGETFWSFYGKYALMSMMFDSLRSPVGRSSWDGYRRSRRSGQPYFGPTGREFGTGGTFTRTTNRSFYDRQMSRQRSQQRSFADKVGNRTRRSNMSGVRNRSGGRRGGK